MARNSTRTMKLKKRRRRRILLSIFTLCLVAFLASGAALGYFWVQAQSLVDNTNNELDRGEYSQKREVAVSPEHDSISVLFLGVDNRDGELDGISDAMMLATFNHEDSTIKMLSIPRDSYVEIPGYAQNTKINHAHSFGGPNLAVETVENFLEVPVDYYVTLNFDAFIEIIDTFGGVDVNVPFAFSEQDSEGNPDAIQLAEGEQTLGGEEALAYVRMRKQDPMGDLGRGERQTEVLASLAEEATSLSSITSYNSVFNQLQENMNMNLSFNDILSFHSYIDSLNNIERFQLEGENYRENGVDYILVDDTSRANATRELRQHLDLEETDSDDIIDTQTAGEELREEFE